MEKAIDNQIKEAEKNLQKLRDKQQAQIYEIPPLEKKARELVKYNYSDAYIQSRLYAMRTSNVGINDIVNIIEKVKSEVVTQL